MNKTNNINTMTDKKEDFLSKISRLAEKAEDLIENEVEKLKESGVVDKISDYIDKTVNMLMKR